ncbi:MAG: response regulator [Lachnospiraceae bacterium]|nr:response regulator [Lachnospiraceae bacterium]
MKRKYLTEGVSRYGKFFDSNGLKRKVLIVDDELINREILGNILAGHYEVSYAGNGEEAIEKLTDGSARFSLILLDLLMPVMDGFELLEKIEADENLKNIPVIVMTSEKPAEVKSIKLGASDFITKPYDMPEVILARCERIIQLYEDNSIIKAAEKDELTCLFTREFFIEYIHQFEMYDQNKALDAICLNIEHFHMLNETYGRKIGDEVLKNTASILMKTFQDGSIGCRSDADNYYICAFHREDYGNVFDELHEELAKISQMPKIRLNARMPNWYSEILE